MYDFIFEQLMYRIIAITLAVVMLLMFVIVIKLPKGGADKRNELIGDFCFVMGLVCFAGLYLVGDKLKSIQNIEDSLLSCDTVIECECPCGNVIIKKIKE